MTNGLGSFRRVSNEGVSKSHHFEIILLVVRLKRFPTHNKCTIRTFIVCCADLDSGSVVPNHVLPFFTSRK